MIYNIHFKYLNYHKQGICPNIQPTMSCRGIDIKV
jgi:hypothetical protein